jgi:hypothetical protein
MPEMPAAIVSTRLSLALGLFESAGRVAAMLRDLESLGVNAERCRFFVTGPSLTFTPGDLSRLERVIAVECISPNEFDPNQAWVEVLLSRTYPSLAAGLSTTRDAPRSLEPMAPALARQNCRLVQHFQNGGGALVVGLNDHCEQRAIAGLLLRLACAVFTHQMRAVNSGPNAATDAVRLELTNATSARLL